MISLDVKSEVKTSSSSPLSLSTPSDEPKVSFSQLLKGVSDKKDDKVIQNGALILSLGSDEKDTKDLKGMSKLDTLMSLLKSEETLVKDEPIELHPKLTQSLSPKEIKVLVKDAKEYLKDKIESSDGYIKSQVKDLPKTLKGLASLAKKFDIDISKITVEEVQPSNVKEIPKDLKTKALHVEEIVKDKEVKVQTSPLKELVKDKEVKTQASPIKEIATSKEVKVQASAIKEIATSKEVKTQASPIKEIAMSKEVVKDKEVKTQTSPIKEISTSKEVKTEASPIKELATNKEVVKEQLNDEKFVQVQKDIKATPLFKAKAEVQHTTTEQIVQVRTNSSVIVEQKTPKDKADETLKLLLRGEKPAMSNPNLTADFSVATAKVIAPNATTNAAQSLDTLLHGESSSEQTPSSKVDGLSTHKAGDFEVKLNEAKQMIKYLSADVKTAIEDYKSPFTRVKVQLNPQRLGEVDVTIVSRGKNLHVNISSNNVAINTLAMNANDLKVQLSNNGINNASLNFNNNSQDGQNTPQQQQNRQNERQANEEYNYFDNEEANEEIISSLEIVVPQYV